MSTQETITDDQRTAALETQVVTKVALIAQMARIIEGCAQRGAFKAEEMEYVGNIYNILSKTVKEAVDKVKETSTKETEEKPETVTEETPVEVSEKTDVDGQLEVEEEIVSK